MCCRYYTPAEMSEFMLTRYLDLINDDVKYGEIFPTDMSPVIISTTEGCGITSMKWGFSGAKSPIFNARGETLQEKSIFKPYYRKRCTVFCSEYYEWKGKERYKIQSADGSPLFLAGIWREKGQKEFTIITVPPVIELAQLHDRMPFVLTEASALYWLTGKDESFVSKGIPKLVYSVG